MPNPRILVVDDEVSVREGLGRSLHGTGYEVIFADGPESALTILRDEPVDVVVSDHLMPGMTGLEFLKVVRDRHPDTVRIMLTGHADLETVVEAINQGEIYRFLHKPCDRTTLRVTLHLALEKLELERENRRLLALIRTQPELAQRIELVSRDRESRRVTL